MLITIIKALLCIMLCFIFSSCSVGCGDVCIKHQDVAGVENINLSSSEADIDSIFIIANDSIIGCGNPRYGNWIGSKTHRVKFPINARIKLFSQGDLLKELSFKMPKNTVLSVYTEYDCSTTMESPYTFLSRMEAAKKGNRFIDSEETDVYCWLLEKMSDSYDDRKRCTELSVDGEVDYVCAP